MAKVIAEKMTCDYADNKIIINLECRTIKPNLKAYDTIKDLGEVLIDAEITKHREHRSRNANDYMWVLLDKMADALHNTRDKYTLYRDYIQKYGVFTPVPIPTKDVEAWCKNWETGGVGWVAVIVGDSKIPNYTVVHAHFGSSTYDSYQMMRLLEAIIADAQDMGIETITPAERERLCKMMGE